MQARYLRIIFLVLGLVMLSACTHLASVGGKGSNDSGPLWKPRNIAKIPDAVPKWEPKSKRGNHSPYKVFGKKYHVMKSAEQYKETGIASWYGRKFHGRTTSSGEVYDMFKMTAAHKSLPLPTYVRVTNLSNGRQIVVKVNDRGPFVHKRVIDLSYAAATKLGFEDKGVAKVKVEAITPPHPAKKKEQRRVRSVSNDAASTKLPSQTLPSKGVLPAPPPVTDLPSRKNEQWKNMQVGKEQRKSSKANPLVEVHNTKSQQPPALNNAEKTQVASVAVDADVVTADVVAKTHVAKTEFSDKKTSARVGTHLQVEAFSHRQAADGLRRRLSALMDYPVYVIKGVLKERAIYRVRVGPLYEDKQVKHAADIIDHHQLGPPMFLSLPD